MKLAIVPVRFRHARSFVADWHRHSGLPQGALFCLGVADESGELHGVATVGGASLRAAGWRVVAERPAHRGWSRASRPRDLNGAEGQELLLWEAS